MTQPRSPTPDATAALIRDLSLSPMTGSPRAMDRGVSLSLCLGLGLALALVAAIWGVRPDIVAALTGPAGLLKLIGGAAILGAGLMLSRRLARPDAELAPALAWILPLAGLAALALFAANLPAQRLAAIAAHAPGCVLPILALGLAPAAATLAALRRGAATRPGLAGAMAGLAGGAAGALAWAMACPAEDPAFVALSYGAALAIFALAGALAGRRVLAW